MKKVCLMVQEKSQEDALTKLRDVGVLHLEKKDVPININSNAQKLKIKVEDAIGLISDYKVPKKKKEPIDPNDKRTPEERRQKPAGMHRGRRATDVFGTDEEAPYSIDAVRAPKRPYLPDLMIGFGEERKELKEKYVVLSREVNRLEGWGDFDPSIIGEIISYGLPVYLYEISLDVFSQLDQKYNFIKVKGDKSIVRLIVFEEKLPGITPFQLPEKRLSVLKQELDENKTALDGIEAKLQGFADRRPALDNEMEKIEKELEFETAVCGMTKVEDIPEGLSLSWLTGYIPAYDLGKVKKVSHENGWALSAYDPDPDDAPPTKIASNPFVRVIHPLLSFLGTVPGYREFDISPSYLFFFSIFFAMILGDAGYGALVFSLAVFMGVSGKIKTGTFSDVAKLLMLLTFTTIVWGAINGAWFQIPQEHLPVFLKVLIIPPFNNAVTYIEFPIIMQKVFSLPEIASKESLDSGWYIQLLCFTFALIQLVWARGKRIFSLLPSLTAFAQLGTLIMMFGLYFLVLNMLLRIDFPQFAMVLIIIGVSLNLVFAEQNGGNFFKNLGKGFGNAFQLFLKCVSCFADIISYIRLFAVGLAGAMIAQIFNQMALPADGFGVFGLDFIIKLVAAVLILVIGHGLNLVLTALSVIVHGVRLNLLEYAGNHLEMEWSGYLYNPFALKQKKK
ncbi:MAG: V-type ATP synthase subunit I [Treponema sp.]|nr:V-type ATP synthase subunit I [Treponema sp.]